MTTNGTGTGGALAARPGTHPAWPAPPPAGRAVIGHNVRVNDQPMSDPLLDTLIETERYVASAGWEQPPRLFALVPTARLVELEPSLAGQLGSSAGALSSIEQEGLGESFAQDDLDIVLASLAWPDEVEGVALAIERLVLPPSARDGLPEDPAELARAAAGHPDRTEVRLLAGVHRDGSGTCLLRQRLHDDDADVAIGRDIAPGLLDALARTLLPEE